MSACAFPVLLEDSWEAADVIEECARLGITCTELAPEELRANYSAETFVGEHTFMCNTDLVQEKLREYFGCGDLEAVGAVPCTYPQEFLGGVDTPSVDTSSLDSAEYFFARTIRRRTLGEVAAELESSDFKQPLFVKPASNDKAFDGKVVRDKEDLEAILEEVRKTAAVDSFPVFTAPPVRFRIEYRLFIGGGRIYRGTTSEDSSGDSWYMVRAEPGLDTLFAEKGAGKQGACPVPDAAFVDAILDKVGPERFWVVDIGLVAAEAAEEQWAIVEVNPPFSVDDHGLEIELYCQYCFHTCAWIRGLRK